MARSSVRSTPPFARVAERRETLLEAVAAFVARHPDRKSFVRKLRKYAKAWGTSGKS